MLNVGLTGNVASGKSTVARWFAEWGATVIDADDLVRQVQAPGSDVVRQIAQRFGGAVVKADGSLDRAALRGKVFADPAALQALNSIVHPAVAIARASAMHAARQRGDKIVVQDIPLLFEVLDPKSFDMVVLVDAPPKLRRERIIAERGLSPAEADRLIQAQMPAEQKRPRSQIVIDNEGSLTELERQARQAWENIRRRS
jgi:dephospho-CoA kinase